MHIPDGFFDAPTSVAAGAVAVGGVAVAIRRTREQMAEKEVALAGLTSAFLFAVQMMNFPVAAGTSGHLLGGVLAAVLVGPWLGVLCLTVVVVVQCLLFADGGLSALGLNVVNMALVPCLGGWVVFRGLRLVLPRSHAGVVVAAGVAAGLSVVLAAVAFTVEYAVGGTADVSVRAVLGAMVGVHTLIGVGEGVITGAVVAAVLAARPDLVVGARDLLGAVPVPSAAAPAGEARS
ncbi:MAG: energy-coupling factor ABC transporter permease [Acidimicrobiales bacterium]|nr:energy-coupling factor ABC transporter permease [Acidimicrobiales bacterium]